MNNKKQISIKYAAKYKYYKMIFTNYIQNEKKQQDIFDTAEQLTEKLRTCSLHDILKHVD